MAIIQTIDKCQFEQAFRAFNRQDQFSYEALEALFDYYEQYSDDTGEPFELDVIAICCDWSEAHWSDIAKNYRIDIDGMDEDAAIEAVLEYLSDNTSFIELSGGLFVYIQF